jgi:small subunit ribosomal protein S20
VVAIEQTRRRVIANKAGGAGNQNAHWVGSSLFGRKARLQRAIDIPCLSIAPAPGRVGAAVDAPGSARYRARLHPLDFSRDAAWFPSAKALSKDHIMANTKSAKKAVRQTSRRTTSNKTRRSRMRSSVRKVEEAIASGNKEAARAALKEAEPIIVRTAQKGMVHRKTASRKVSRLAKRVGAMGTP